MRMSKAMSNTLEKLDITILERLARRAGKMALRYFRHVKPERKEDQSMVTKADREVEKFLRHELEKMYPDHGILGEEFGKGERTIKTLKDFRFVWVIDPIDG